jgi:Icc-related predicted phosphoesterase
MRIFFVSDVHGSERCFKKFVNAAKFYSVDVLILGGDLTGKAIVPVIENRDGTWNYEYFGEKRTVHNKLELENAINFLSDLGYYPYITNKEETIELQNDKNKLNELFLKLMKERLRHWVVLAEERLKSTKVKCYISPGNDDPLGVEEVIKNSDVVINPEGRLVTLGNFEMITLGYTNPTPWKSPRELEEDELRKVLENLIDKIQKPEQAIFNFHCPPYNTKLDECPMLTKDLKPVFSGGSPVLQHVGSISVREAIEKVQPMLGLHGHVHEARAIEKIGRTICLNPGSQYLSGILNGAIIQVDAGKVKNYMLTSG